MTELSIRLYILPLFIAYLRIPIYINLCGSYLIIEMLWTVRFFATITYKKNGNGYNTKHRAQNNTY